MDNEKITVFPNWIFEQDLTPVEFRALLGLYSFRDSTTNTMFPGLLTLAKRVGLPQDRSYMSKIIARLCDKGLLEKHSRGHGKSNLYKLTNPCINYTTNPCINSPTPPCINYTTPLVQTIQPYLTNNIPSDLTKEQKDQNYKGLALKHDSGIETKAIQEFIDHRNKKKAPLTQNALDRFIERTKAIAENLRLTPEQIIEETIDAGWQSMKEDWLIRRMGLQTPKQTARERAKRKLEGS